MEDYSSLTFCQRVLPKSLCIKNQESTEQCTQIFQKTLSIGKFDWFRNQYTTNQKRCLISCHLHSQLLCLQRILSHSWVVEWQVLLNSTNHRSEFCKVGWRNFKNNMEGRISKSFLSSSLNSICSRSRPSRINTKVNNNLYLSYPNGDFEIEL